MTNVRALCCVAGSVALAFNSLPVQAQDNLLVFNPSTAWQLDYGDNSCALRRNFSSEAASVTLQMEARLNANWLSFAVVSSDLPRARGDLELRVEPDDGTRDVEGRTFGEEGGARGAVFQSSLLPSSAGANESVFVQLSLPIEERAARERAITGIFLSGAFQSPIQLNTGSLGNAMTALRECLDNLWISWGIDPRLNDAAAVMSVRDGVNTWARRVQEAYPRDMVRAGRNATVYVVLEINGEGRVQKCHAHNPEPYPSFEVSVCEALTEYARYIPAQDSSGNPVSSFDTMTVLYSTR